MADMTKRSYRALPKPGDVKLSLVKADHDGWLLLDGRQTLPRAGYARLFGEIGTTYGVGDGATTFGLPSASDGFLLAAGPRRALGTQGGAETHALTADELPEHDHGYDRTGKTTGPVKLAAGLVPLTLVNDVTTATGSTSKVGKGRAFSLLPPYLALNAFVYAGM